MKSDPSLLRQSYLKVTSVGILVIMAAAVGLWLLAEPIVTLAFGSKWAEAIPLLRMLALNGLLTISKHGSPWEFGSWDVALHKPCLGCACGRDDSTHALVSAALRRLRCSGVDAYRIDSNDSADFFLLTRLLWRVKKDPDSAEAWVIERAGLGLTKIVTFFSFRSQHA